MVYELKNIIYLGPPRKVGETEFSQAIDIVVGISAAAAFIASKYPNT